MAGLTRQTRKNARHRDGRFFLGKSARLSNQKSIEALRLKVRGWPCTKYPALG